MQDNAFPHAVADERNSTPIERYHILGGGAVTSEYYLPALYLTGRLERSIIVDPDASAARDKHAAYAVAGSAGSDYASYLASLPACGDRNECVIVALPNHLHVDAVRRALASGRHVLCEKPLALDAEACTELTTLAQRHDRQVKVAMSRRYLPSLMLARDIAEGRELGAITRIDVLDSTPFGWKPRSFAFFGRDAGGVLADMGVHYLDYVETLVGEMTPIDYSDDARGGTESSLRYLLDASGVAIEMRLSRIRQNGAFMKIRFERGEILVQKSHESEIHVRPSKGSARTVSAMHPFDDARWPNDFHGSFAQMLMDFDRAVGGGKSRIADVRDAERTTALIEWAYRRSNRLPRTSPPTAARRPGVLVTGATGFIGGHLVERLCSDGSDVRAAVRSPASCANVTRFPVTLAPVDLLESTSVRNASEGVRTVYHLAYGTDGPDARRITIEGTKNVVEAAISARTECVVVLSTMYVFGFPEAKGPVDETFPYAPYGGEYAESKAAMEQWCLDRARTSGSTRIVVLNPTCVFGPAGGAYTCLPLDLAANGRFCWIEDGRGAANYVYVGNLVDAMLAAATVDAAHGERFIVSDGTVTWRELLGPFVEPMRTDVPSYTVEQFARLPRFGGPFRIRDLLKSAASSPEVRAVAKRSAIVRRGFDVAGRIWQRPPMGSDPIARLAPAPPRHEQQEPPPWLAQLYGTARAEFSAAKAQRVLGWAPRIDLARAQAETIAWLREVGRLPPDATDNSLAAASGTLPG